jgi:hypothetical protein
VKENSDAESSEESSENGEEIESGEIEGEEIEGEEVEGEEVEGEEVEGEEIEVEFEGIEVEGQAEEMEIDEIENAGHVKPDTVDSAGPVGPDGSGPVGPTGSAGSLGAPVPAISILPPTPVKNKGKGKGKGTPDDNQDDTLQDKPDLNPDSLMVDDNEPGGLKRGRERSGTGEVRGSKTHRRSASHSTAPTVPSTEDDDMDDLDEIDPEGSSRSTGGFSRGRAVGNYYSHADADDFINPEDWNAPPRGKVLLFVNRDPGTSPYMSFTTETTSELPVVLEELSGRFSPVEKRDCRIYVYEDEMWEVKGRFSQAVLDDSPVQWEMNGEGQLILPLLVVGVFLLILFTFIT